MSEADLPSACLHAHTLTPLAYRLHKCTCLPVVGITIPLLSCRSVIAAPTRCCLTSQLTQQPSTMAPKADKTPVKKVAKKGTSDKKKKRSKAETYKIYIYKVLKQVRAAPCPARIGTANAVIASRHEQTVYGACRPSIAQFRQRKSMRNALLTPSAPAAGAPRHRYLQPSHVHHELVHQRPVREDRDRGIAVSALQQESRQSHRGRFRTAVRLILPGELAKHAVSEGTKAVTKFSSS